MGLGLFNCRLIQPAGDQLFLLSAVLPHRHHFRGALFSFRVTRPARPPPAGGRRMLLVFPSQKDFVLVFRGGEAPSDAEGFTPIELTREFPRRFPNPTHRFCYRAGKTKPSGLGSRHSSTHDFRSCLVARDIPPTRTDFLVFGVSKSPRYTRA